MMRALSLAVLAVLAGCVEAEPTAPSPPSDTTSFGPETPLPNGTVDAPTHPVGRAWTYRGIQEYNPEPEFTVVVAAADGSGYLFAGAAEKDLVYEALWGDPLHGRRDLSLNRIDLERPALDFPLWDGKTWAYSDSLTLTARRASVASPGGSESGFIIEGSNERVTRRFEYSPSLGQIVRTVTTGADGAVIDDHAIVRVEEGRSWVWYELGPLSIASSTHEPAAFEVPSGYDHVIASAGGTHGSRARVQAPDGSAWSSEFDGAEAWHHGMLPATPGRWVGSVAGQPDLDALPDVAWPVGWGYMHVAPVRWLRGG